MRKLLFVLGTRPEAIKLAPLILEFKKHPDFEVIVCSTGQHKEMLEQVFKLFDLKADYELSIMKPGQDLTHITSRVLETVRDVLAQAQPDVVFVQGDTTTTMASALASFYSKIPVAHIEAGLRTYNRYSPWPEEINRQMTTRMANYHFPPTEESRQNLIKEGIADDVIAITGNTVIDALLFTVDTFKSSEKVNAIESELAEAGYVVEMMRQELTERYGSRSVFQGGLRVTVIQFSVKGGDRCTIIRTQAKG